MYVLKKDKKEEENASGGSPYSNLEKTSVLQEARIFNESHVNPRKCGHILTKVLYLLNQGEQLGTTEATETFFAMTKLFQSKDPVLRRLVYLGIKELSKVAEDVIIVTSSLTKDMTGKENQYRAAAVRALCKITDSGMLQAIERYMKQAIVDRNHSVSSAALVSSLHLMKVNYDVVKRWVNETQEAVNTDDVMVQIRIANKLIRDDDARPNSPLFEFIESCLRHKNEMVVYEAARTIVNLKSTTPRELAPSISVLQLFCSSSKPTLRFAAVRTLNKVAMSHPAAVTACNTDLENLITDVNRSIATLAITTLLNTGSESSVERLMKQISGFMSEISDEFKTVVVQAVRSLCQKFPHKHSVMMNFLSSMLREEGGFEYKKTIVDTIMYILEDNQEAKEAGLAYLCEFIEDCEHTSLAVRILHMLGKEGPRTSLPSKYIRFIYNRLVLENSSVRAAAVSSLAKFGAHCENVLPNILVLLQRSLLDTDDEVRDRATYYLKVLMQKQRAFSSQYILNGLQVSLVGLEKALHHYTLEPSEAPFDIKTVPLSTQFISEEKKSDIIEVGRTKGKLAESRQDIFAEQLASVAELAAVGLGPLFKSSQPVELTESETEYVVHCIKHTFPNHIVLQFNCINTLNDQILENVQVEVEPSEGFELVCNVPCSKLPYNVTGTTYTCLRLPDDAIMVAGTFSNTLKYLVKDCDPNIGEADEEGYEDEYILEDLEVTVTDHVQKTVKPNFAAAWEELGPDNELEDTFALTSMKTMEESIKNIIQFVGMQPCEQSDKAPEGKNAHTLFLAGVYRGGHDVLVRAKLALGSSSEGVTMNLAVRSMDPNVSEVIASAIG
ncbi:coatomer subunit gamma-2-like isoform X2 [Tachypleus tridentatus]|uniref:coatomer subunit gamma-2-like isoform X2 n=1 Tax=Tachypleus tridentatus TaxID=6853 RepID=UPI003FCF08B3